MPSMPHQKLWPMFACGKQTWHMVRPQNRRCTFFFIFHCHLWCLREHLVELLNHHSWQLAIRFQGEHFYNFFEVGEIRLADSAGIARWSKASKAGEGFQIIQPIETVEYPTKAGGITSLGGEVVDGKKQMAENVLTWGLSHITYVYTYIYIYLHTHTHIYIYIYPCVCI